MENIISIINDIQSYIVIVLLVIVVILLILLFIAFRSINQLEQRYRKFMRGLSNKNIEELVIGYLDKIDEVKNSSDEVRNTVLQMNKVLNKCIQKTSVIRYKAFENVGSDLSFSISLLDHNDDGVIITGLYGRNESTTYAKPIDKGISRYELSDEEKHVLSEAIFKKI